MRAAGRVVAAALLAALVAFHAASAPSPTLPYPDVQGPLRQALQELAPTGALGVFQGDRFRPQRAITVGEFARLAVSVFGLQAPASADPEQAAIEVLRRQGVLGADALQRAHLPLSQLQLLQAGWQLAGLGDLRSLLPSAGTPQALGRLAQAAGLSGWASGEPDGPPSAQAMLRSATREQAVLTLARLRQLRRVEGELTSVGPQRLRVHTAREAGSDWPVAVPSGSLVVRNGRWASLSQLQPGDRVEVVVDSQGRAVLVAASSPALPSPWVEQGRLLLQELARRLTPEQWQALLRGDWNGLVGSLTPQLYDGLMTLGIAPWEAEALLRGDWATVRELAGRRVADEAARQLGVSPQVMEALLKQDWPAARQLAQQELLQRLLEQLIGPQYLPQLPQSSTPSSAPRPATDTPFGPAGRAG